LLLHMLDKFWLKVKLCGFYFASLDIRLESAHHREVLQILLQKHEQRFPMQFKYAEYMQNDVRTQMDFLLSWKDNFEEGAINEESVLEMIPTFQSMKKIQEGNGVDGCHRYIVNNCGSAFEVAEVLALARLFMGYGFEPPLDIVPLFEKVDYLSTAADTMEALYSHPQYSAHLALRGKQQTIMLGFSDGTKDGGYLRANRSIYHAKEALTLKLADSMVYR